MFYDLENNKDIINAKKRLEYFIEAEAKIEIKKTVKTRSALQNRALHLFFTMLSDELNNIGLEYQYIGLKGTTISMRYTSHLVKEFVWRPIQMTLFNIESTTKISTKEINQILDILTNFFGERGIPIVFPSEFDKYLKQISNEKPR